MLSHQEKSKGGQGKGQAAAEGMDLCSTAALSSGLCALHGSGKLQGLKSLTNIYATNQDCQG